MAIKIVVGFVKRAVRCRLGALEVDLALLPARRRGCLIPSVVGVDELWSLIVLGAFFSSGLIIHHDDLPVPSL